MADKDGTGDRQTNVSDLVAPPSSTTIHGVMVEVFGIGVLIVGDSGIGKSECALELISKGHRLVSDDAVTVTRVGDELTAIAPESIRDFLEIRGLGIINAKELFGASSIAPSGTIKLCMEFAGRENIPANDRLGLEESSIDLLGIPIRRFPIPVRPGRNLATLVETAVRVFASRKSGSTAVEDLITRHQATLTSNGSN